MNEYTSLFLGLVYGVVVFLAVLGWMKIRKSRMKREREKLQPNLFGSEGSNTESDKRNEVAMAQHV